MVFDPWFDDRVKKCESRTVNGLTNEQVEGIARRLLNYFNHTNGKYDLRTETASDSVTFFVVRHGLLSTKRVMGIFCSSSGDGVSGYLTELEIYPAALHDAATGAKREADRLIKEYTGAR